jgi:hypothetical protein
MSASQTFVFCIDCWQIDYGISDSNGVYQRDSAASNHWDHACHVFGRPADYSPPIKAVLTRLHAGAPISDPQMWLFSLALAIEAIEPNNGIAVKPVEKSGKDRSAVGVGPSAQLEIGDAA